VLILTPEAYLPLRNVGAQFHASTEGASAAQQALNVLDTPARQGRLAPGPLAAADLRSQEICLRGVTVRYPDRDSPALSDLSLVIRPGEHIAVTGPSGAGKSSLLAVLLRLAEPTAGMIEVGGTSLAQIDVAQWRAQVAWVPQHPHLFAATVAANIALGKPGAVRDAVERAAVLAGADAFIRDLADGYDTPLGERGLQLSAGQRQRIALARAFLVDAPLLLLDEPTAHLDPFSAHELQDSLAALLAGRTVVQVTHDEAAAAAADRVLTLRAGRLVQQTAPLLVRAGAAEPAAAPVSVHSGHAMPRPAAVVP